MLMILPRRRGSISRAASWQRRNTACRFTWRTRCQSSGVVSIAGARLITPALLTRMSTRPSACTAPGMTVSTLSGSSRSAVRGTQRRPNRSTPVDGVEPEEIPVGPRRVDGEIGPIPCGAREHHEAARLFVVAADLPPGPLDPPDALLRLVGEIGEVEASANPRVVLDDGHRVVGK